MDNKANSAVINLFLSIDCDITITYVSSNVFTAVSITWCCYYRTSWSCLSRKTNSHSPAEICSPAFCQHRASANSRHSSSIISTTLTVAVHLYSSIFPHTRQVDLYNLSVTGWTPNTCSRCNPRPRPIIIIIIIWTSWATWEGASLNTQMITARAPSFPTHFYFNSTFQCSRRLGHLCPHNPRGRRLAVPAFLDFSLDFYPRHLYYRG